MKALITDVSMVLLFPKDKNYSGSLNSLYKEKFIGTNNSFFDLFELNRELLDFYKSLSNKLDIHILTSDVIQDAPDLQPYWNGTIDRIFSASKMGTHKSEPEAYKKVLSELNLRAEEVIYIDDNIENIKAANVVGLQTIQYKDNSQTILATKSQIDGHSVAFMSEIQTEDMKVEIIKLQPSQWEAYKNLRLRALQEEPQAFGSSYAENVSKPDNYWVERLTDVEQGKNWLVFAKQNDNLVGMMGGFRKNDDLEDVVNVIAVYVVKEARGKGVSKKLMQALLEEFAKDPSIKKAKLSVNKDQIPAVKLYESFGFKVVGEENVQLGDGNLHEELVMEKRLL